MYIYTRHAIYECLIFSFGRNFKKSIHLGIAIDSLQNDEFNDFD